MKRLFVFCFFCLLLAGSKLHSQLTFTISSSNNSFTLTCSSPSLNLLASSNYSQPVTYTWGTPNVTVSSTSAHTATVPGTYVITASSGTTGATQTITIYADTTPPAVNVSFPTNTLSCNVPSVQLQASSNMAGVSYTWASPSFLPPVTTSSIQVNTTSIPANTLIVSYTLIAQDPANGCKTTTIIPVFQNIFPPNALIASTSNAFTCNTASIALTNNSTSGNPTPGPFPGAVSGFAWYGPGVSPPASNTSIYLAYTPGTYTMIAKDLNNGCVAAATITLADNRIYPIVSTQNLVILPCPGAVTLSVSALGSSITYSWTAPSGATINGANTATLTTNAPGYYQVAVTNSFGCTVTVTVSVWACVGIAEQNHTEQFINVFPNPTSDKLYLEADGTLPADLDLSLVDAVGQTVYSPSPFTGSELDLSSLKPGLYYLRIRSGERQNVFRIIKE